MTSTNQGVKLRKMRLPRCLFPALLLAGIVIPAFAQDEEPLRPEDAYRYVVSDTGDALEIDWAVEDGYYLYKNKLGFESATDGVVLGEPEMPRGLDHEDEFFGKQEIYRDNFYVTVPYTVTGERPETLDLLVKSQGCADLGLCYPPQTWTETVKLRSVSSETPKLSLESVGQPANDFLPVDEAFQALVVPIDGNTLEVSFRVTPGHYLYKEKLFVRTSSDRVQLGQLSLPEGKLKYDEFFGEQEVFFDDVLATLPLARATPEAMGLEVDVEFQGCAEGGLCYPPTVRTIAVELPEATAVSELSATPDAPVSEQGRLAKLIVEANLWAVIATFFGLGLLLALTPCVLPMVPILTSIIAGEGEDTTPMRGFTLALSYVMGMAIVYTAAGVIAVLLGWNLQAAFNQPWVLILFTTLFILLALAMFGGYDLQMPSGIQSRLATVSGNQKSGTTIGAFIMGALSALIVTACVAPALIATLMVMAQTKDILRGGASLFAMSLGMGAPLLAVGAAQGHLLPKAGAWMVAIKNAFGFMLLGLAIWMMSRILPPLGTMVLWGIWIFMVGVFLGGLTSLGPESSGAQKFGKGFGLLGILYGLLLLLAAFMGSTNPLQPLANVNFGGGAFVAEHHELEFKRIKTVDDLDREIAAAAASGRTAMLDFYADWCVSCKEMEAYTFTDAEVHDVLADTVLLQADVTANDEQDQELLQRFGVFGPPTIVFFGTDGIQRSGYEVVGYMKAKDFAEHVVKAFAAPAPAKETPSTRT